MPSSAPAPEFNFDEVSDHFLFLASVLTLLEPPSPVSSADPREDKVPPLDPSRTLSQPSDATPVTSSLDAHPESSQRHSMFKKLLRRKSKEDPTLHKPSRRSGKSRQPADHQSPSHSPTRVDDANERPSRMAAAERNAVSAVAW